jgi:hypothetical protein
VAEKKRLAMGGTLGLDDRALEMQANVRKLKKEMYKR